MAQCDIGIDLGSYNLRVYKKDKGVVIKEPSLVAYDKDSDRIVAFGEEARQVVLHKAGSVVAIKPLKAGVISDYTVTEALLKHFMTKAMGRRTFRKPFISICLPAGTTSIERRAVEEATYQAGARDVTFVDEAVAAAIGAGIDITKPFGNMIVDIGSGTTDIAVISIGDSVIRESIKIAGDTFDEAISRYIRRHHSLFIDEGQAEDIKIRIGCAWPREEPRAMDVKGRCLIQGLPRLVHVESQELPDALQEPITAVVEAICSVIERTPPELVGDIIQNGIVMTGGGSLLYGLDRLIEYVTGIRTRVAPKAVSCVAIGTGMSLEKIGMLPDSSVVNIARLQEERL